MKEILEHLYISLRCIVKPKDNQGINLHYKNRHLRNKIIEYYKNNPTNDESINNALYYLKEYGFSTPYPYKYRESYNCKDFKINVEDKQSDNMFYLYPDKKRLYLRHRPIHRTQRLLQSLFCEQDKDSSHRYLNNFLQVENGDVMVDVGCAEAFLSLQNIEKLKHLYLFECDEEWIEALKKTFKPWEEKVTIVNKYVSEKDSDNEIRLDTYFKDIKEKPTFIKMDIEGAETKALNGLGNLWETDNLKLAVCTYHLHDDYNKVTSILKDKQFKTQKSDNYILASVDEMAPPYFRVGLVRAKK